MIMTPEALRFRRCLFWDFTSSNPNFKNYEIFTSILANLDLKSQVAASFVPKDFSKPSALANFIDGFDYWIIIPAVSPQSKL